MVLKIGETVVDFNPAFRLYLSTKLSNPKLAPEAYARLNVLNFSATSEGLVEQMLGIVVTSEAPDLETQSEQQRREIADYGRLVADMEDRVLELLSGDVSTRLLDDEHVITTLSESKAVSNRAKDKIAAAERLQKRLQTTRGEFTTIATRAASLYFCVASLSAVDPMYQFSLEWFTRLFQQALGSVGVPKRTPARVKELISTFTYLLYSQVSRALFSRVRGGPAPRRDCGELCALLREHRVCIVTFVPHTCVCGYPAAYLRLGVWSILCECT